MTIIYQEMDLTPLSLYHGFIKRIWVIHIGFF